MRRVVRAVPVLLVLASAVTLLWPRGADTVPLYAARNGLNCQTCHFDPNGGGPRNDFGFAFARNRHEIVPEPEGSPWTDLELTNKVGETMPVYFGVNQRFMALTRNTKSVEGVDQLGFFNMENALHVAFQPHPKLTLVYTTDAFDGGGQARAESKDAWGMIGGLPLDGYLKAGRFRTPFGLRFDDHTVATRNGYLDFGTMARFLPYDPRDPDDGVELGGTYGPVVGRFAFTNGGANVLFGERAETKTVKLIYNMPSYQGGVSFYDALDSRAFPTQLKRATRWGYYGMTHWGPLAAIAEIGAGTDETAPTAPGTVTGPKTNLLAWMAELDYAPVRWINARVRYDRLVTDRSTDSAVRDAHTHSRYALEAEYVPVPFAELRATVRRIDHEDNDAYGFEDETQGYLQFHFSY